MFEYHQESIQKFSIVYRQITKYFNGKADVDALIPIGEQIDEVLLLGEKLLALEDEMEVSRAKFRHADLIALATRRKTYLREKMPMAEISTQIQAVDQLRKRFSRNSLKAPLLWAMALLVIIILILVLGLITKDS